MGSRKKESGLERKWRELCNSAAYEKSIGNWEIERTREILRAMGKTWDFDISDIPADELAEKVGNAVKSRRMREAPFSIEQECGATALKARRRLIWDEVMK